MYRSTRQTRRGLWSPRQLTETSSLLSLQALRVIEVVDTPLLEYTPALFYCSARVDDVVLGRTSSKEGATPLVSPYGTRKGGLSCLHSEQRFGAHGGWLGGVVTVGWLSAGTSRWCCLWSQWSHLPAGTSQCNSCSRSVGPGDSGFSGCYGWWVVWQLESHRLCVGPCLCLGGGADREYPSPVEEHGPGEAVGHDDTSLWVGSCQG